MSASPDRDALVRRKIYLRDGVLRWRSTGAEVRGHLDRDGYRRVILKDKGRFVANCAAHRLVWFLHHGAWPKQVIDHINRVKLDNRVENLRDVSAAENMLNAERSGPHSKVILRCRQGPVRQHRHAAKLTPEQVIEIRQSSASNAELSRQFKVAPSTISEARSGRKWGWLDPSFRSPSPLSATPAACASVRPHVRAAGELTES
jgi:hypothetical protein